MAIYEITADQILKIPGTTFSMTGLRELYELQRLLGSLFYVTSAHTLITAEEFGDGERDHGRPLRQGLRSRVDQDAERRHD